jgi:hypothetical protein
MKKIMLITCVVTCSLLAQAQSLNKSTSFITPSYDVNQSAVLNSKVIWTETDTLGSQLLQEGINVGSVWSGQCNCKVIGYGCGPNFVCARYCRGKCYPHAIDAKYDSSTLVNETSLGDDYPKIVPMK